MAGTRSGSGPGCDDYYHTGKNQPTYVDLGWQWKKGYCIASNVLAQRILFREKTDDSSTIFDVEPRDWEERVLTRINHEYKNTERIIMRLMVMQNPFSNRIPITSVN